MGRLRGRIGQLSVMVCALGMALLTGCSAGGGGSEPSPISKCPDGSNPDFDNDPENCGTCGIRCDDLRGEAMCLAGVCRLAEPVRCSAGFVDADKNPANGCECLGRNPLTCRTCLTYEIPMNGIDDDCEPSTPDIGLLSDVADVPITRAHCGALGASCTLQPGFADVRCEPVKCTESRAKKGECGLCEGAFEDDFRWCAQCIPTGESVAHEATEDCFDGKDQDGNDIRDDGPECEVLLANASTRDCNLAVPSEACPPNMVTIPSAGSALPELQVGLTYDVAMDRYEVSRGQFAVYLKDQGFCDPKPGAEVHPECGAEDRPLLPVTGVNWCEAYDYCRWAGKRLPTLAEYYRAAGADTDLGVGDIDAQGPRQSEAERCTGIGGVVLPECDADGPRPVHSLGGMGFVGHVGRQDQGSLSAGFHHLTGNVAEWVFDARVDWCATEGPHRLAPFRGLVCDERGRAHLRQALYDFAPSPLELDEEGDGRTPRRGQQRLLCGGGWGSAVGAARYDTQQAIDPGARSTHYGFRCARTFHDDPAVADAWPYARELPGAARAECPPRPMGGAAVRQSPDQTVWRVTEGCLRDVSADQSGLRARFALPQSLVLMSIEGFADEVGATRLQSGVDVGTEQLWLSGLEPIVAKPPEDVRCRLSTCRGLKPESPADSWLALPGPEGFAWGVLELSVRAMAFVPSSSCMRTQGPVLRLSTEVDAEGMAFLLARAGDDEEGPVLPDVRHVLEALTERGACLDDDEPVCRRWGVELELAFAPLEVE